MQVPLFYHLSTVPTGEPTNVTLEVLSSSSIRIRWQRPPPSEQNGIINGYTIVLTLLMDGNTLIYNVTENTFSHRIEGQSTIMGYLKGGK